MTSRSAVGIRFTAKPVAQGSAMHFEVPEPNLDFDSADVLKAPLADAVSNSISEGYRAFVLDLTSVDRIDSCGVGLLIAMHHQVVASGGTIKVVVISPFVRKVLRMMRLDRFLDLETTVERALRTLVDVD